MRISVHALYRAARRAMLATTVAVVPAAGSVLLLLPASAPAQEAATGKITGRIVDAVTGQPIPAAQIQVVGTAFGTQTAVDGRYTLLRVPAGTLTLQVRRIGYGPKTVTGLLLPANGALEQDISLRSADVQLAAVSVTAT
ncbi:MAG: carboxypeptidase-like regulatory domain-containing protein, partial [Gemmatimonas sp.]